MSIGRRLWVHISQSLLYLLFLIFLSFLVHSLICLACYPCHAITDVYEDPKATTVPTKPTSPIPADPSNSFSFLISIISFFFLLGTYVMLILRSVACRRDPECYVWDYELFCHYS